MAERVSGTGLQQFRERLEAALDAGVCRNLVLSRLRAGMAGPARYTVRPVTIRGALHWQWAHRQGTQEFHENLDTPTTLQRIDQLLPQAYLDATLLTEHEEVQLREHKGQVRFSARRQVQQPVELDHDRQKQYLLPAGQPWPFLVELGVMTPDGRVRGDKQRKFRQINRYLEFVADLYPVLPATGVLQLVDFGCGLSYLTFAVYHLLHELYGRQVELLGIDRNPQVIQRASQLAEKLKLTGMRFQVATIESLLEPSDQLPPPPSEPDLVVSLHACDTATDDTLLWSVRQQARAILAVPCCQHQLSPQLRASGWEWLTRHGIIRERLAALATDALRALALECVGYRAEIVEFIDLEHTAKNLLLRAVRLPDSKIDAVEMQAARERFAAALTQLGTPALAITRLLEG